MLNDKKLKEDLENIRKEILEKVSELAIVFQWNHQDLKLKIEDLLAEQDDIFRDIHTFKEKKK
jgi:hypothetical protein